MAIDRAIEPASSATKRAPRVRRGPVEKGADDMAPDVGLRADTNAVMGKTARSAKAKLRPAAKKAAPRAKKAAAPARRRAAQPAQKAEREEKALGPAGRQRNRAGAPQKGKKQTAAPKALKGVRPAQKKKPAKGSPSARRRVSNRAAAAKARPR